MLKNMVSTIGLVIGLGSAAGVIAATPVDVNALMAKQNAEFAARDAANKRLAAELVAKQNAAYAETIRKQKVAAELIAKQNAEFAARQKTLAELVAKQNAAYARSARKQGFDRAAGR